MAAADMRRSSKEVLEGRRVPPSGSRSPMEAGILLVVVGCVLEGHKSCFSSDLWA